MGREVRKVPPTWEHPKDDSGRYIPLRDHYGVALADFQQHVDENGLAEALDWHGGGPVSDDYMPDWPEEERTHYQMYEDTSEGTPISPVMPDPESLARWLVDNKASSFGAMTASYEAWLRIARGGYAPSAIITDGHLQSGVEALKDN